jgi:hypothetical protein
MIEHGQRATKKSNLRLLHQSVKSTSYVNNFLYRRSLVLLIFLSLLPGELHTRHYKNQGYHDFTTSCSFPYLFFGVANPFYAARAGYEIRVLASRSSFFFHSLVGYMMLILPSAISSAAASYSNGIFFSSPFLPYLEPCCSFESWATLDVDTSGARHNCGAIALFSSRLRSSLCICIVGSLHSWRTFSRSMATRWFHFLVIEPYFL